MLLVKYLILATRKATDTENRAAAKLAVYFPSIQSALDLVFIVVQTERNGESLQPWNSGVRVGKMSGSISFLGLFPWLIAQTTQFLKRI